MISVICKNDSRLHLVREEQGFGRSAHTLCLEKYIHTEQPRTDSQFCAECLTKYQQEEHGNTDQS